VPDGVRVTVGNQGPDDLYEVRVHIGEHECKLGEVARTIKASRQVASAQLPLEKTVTVLVEYEDEAGQSHLLRGTQPFEVFPRGEIRVEVGQGKILSEQMSPAGSSGSSTPP
jgi:hypothetical protein